MLRIHYPSLFGDLLLLDKSDQVGNARNSEWLSNFTGLWDELEFDERQYATRLLLKQVTLNFKKKEKEGSIKIEAWGRRPKPLKICLAKQPKKLRNQNGRLPR